MVAGLFLPLWQREAVAISGWDKPYFPDGRWITLIVAAAAVAWVALPRLRRGRWLHWTGWLAVARCLLVLWRGYKLQAIGPGAWVLLAGACLIMLGSLWKEPANDAA